MYYYFTFIAVDSESNTRYIFEEEEKGRKGWAKLRLCRIQSSNPPQIEDYDPEIHDGKSHYMSHLYNARHFKNTYIRDDGSKYTKHFYTLYGAFGNPTHNINLVPSEEIDIEE
jgi:hypothetical protein